MDPQFRTEPNLQVQQPKKSRTPLAVVLVIILLATTGGVTWWITNNQASNNLSQKDARINELEQANQNLQSQSQDTQPTSSLPNEETIAAIKTAFNEKDYESLTDKLADRISIILAASEGLGMRTPEQVTSDLAILDEATTPWDFELAEETTDRYKSGDYSLYIPEGALIGQSEDNQVIVIGFNGSGKIVNIFISNDATLL